MTGVHCGLLDGVMLYFRSKTYDLESVDPTEPPGSCCTLRKVLDHVHTMSYKTNPDGDDISDCVEIGLDGRLIEEDTIQTCKNCYRMCKLFKKIKGEMDEQNTVILDIYDFNLGYVATETNGTPACLGVSSDTGERYLVVYNLNDPQAVKHSIFLVSVEDPSKWEMLLDVNSVLNTIDIPVSEIDFGRIRVPDIYKEILKEGASVLTLKNVVGAVALYYTLATVSVLIYFNFLRKPGSQEGTEQ